MTSIIDLLNILSINEKKKLYFLFFISFVSSFFEMVGIATLMPFMEVVTSPDIIRTNRLLNTIYKSMHFDSDQYFLFFLGAVLFVLLIISNLFKLLNSWLTLKYGNHLNYVLSRRLLAKYLSRPYSFFLNRNTSDMAKNILAEVRNSVEGCFIAVIRVVSCGFVILFVTGLLLVTEPFISITIVVFLGGAYAGIFLLVRRQLTQISKEQIFAQTMRFRTATEALSGIKDIKVLGREPQFLSNFAVHAERYSLNTISAGTISILPKYVLEVLSLGGILLIVMYSIGAQEESLTKIIPLLAVFAFAGYRILPALQQIFAGIATVRINLPSLELLRHDLIVNGVSHNAEELFYTCDDLLPIKLCNFLEIRDICFRYKADQASVLHKICLTIPRNTSIGLVGTTGSGKTTLVDIILGLLSPTSGKILVDGNEINEKNLTAWQRNFGYVPQQIYLSDDTVARNIAFGVSEEDIDMAAVTRAAQIANLHKFIEKKLPNGYKTVIGERGVRLSGGQKQRIGIARALYAEPEILIMDEGTNALDGVTEKTVIEALETLSGKKTIIMVAHRLTTVKNCDIIYILENGCIIGKGTYEELHKTSDWFHSAARHT